jgi:predicted metalloprotease
MGTNQKYKCGKSKARSNKLSVALELQTDFYAWNVYNQNMKKFS